MIGLLCFSMGNRNGANYQYDQDQVMLEVCVGDVLKLKDEVRQLQTLDAGLTPDKKCSKVCEAISMASDGFITEHVFFQGSNRRIRLLRNT